jgi:outer membrane protein assembly factor BamB
MNRKGTISFLITTLAVLGCGDTVEQQTSITTGSGGTTSSGTTSSSTTSSGATGGFGGGGSACVPDPKAPGWCEGSPQWYEPGPDHDVTGEYVALDGEGNPILAAAVRDKSLFSGDILVTKLDPQGHVIWSKLFGAERDQRPNGVAVDATGNIVLTGMYNGTLAFGATVLTGDDVNGDGKSAFVAKLDPSGNPLWARKVAGTSSMFPVLPTGIAVDGSGRVITGGTVQGALQTDGLSLSGWGTYLLSLDASGQVAWGKIFDGNPEDAFGARLAANDAGVIGFAHASALDLDFGGGPVSGMAIAAFDASGQLLWSRGVPETHISGSVLSGIAVAESGEVTLGGNLINNKLDLDGPLGSDAGHSGFAFRLGADGTTVWKQAYPDTASGTSSLNGLALLPGGDVMIAGSFDGTTSFGGGPLASAGGRDVFVARLDAAGHHVTSKRFGDAETQSVSAAAGSPKAFALVGHFAGTIDFGAGPITAPPGMPESVYVAVLAP